MLFWAAVDKGTLEEDLEFARDRGRQERKDRLSSLGGFNYARGGSYIIPSLQCCDCFPSLPRLDSFDLSFKLAYCGFLCILFPVIIWNIPSEGPFVNQISYRESP